MVEPGRRWAPRNAPPYSRISVSARNCNCLASTAHCILTIHSFDQKEMVLMISVRTRGTGGIWPPVDTLLDEPDDDFVFKHGPADDIEATLLLGSMSSSGRLNKSQLQVRPSRGRDMHSVAEPRPIFPSKQANAVSRSSRCYARVLSTFSDRSDTGSQKIIRRPSRWLPQGARALKHVCGFPQDSLGKARL
jgi:hypothetical protein